MVLNHKRRHGKSPTDVEVHNESSVSHSNADNTESVTGIKFVVLFMSLTCKYLLVSLDIPVAATVSVILNKCK
jgi:hypothetical protein